MGDASEVVREVGVNDFRAAPEQQLFHLDHRLLGIAPGTVRVLFGWKVGFEDRFQHQHRCCHADPIPHGRDAQRPELAVGLRDEHSSDRIRLVALLPERKRQFAKPSLDAIRLNILPLIAVLRVPNSSPLPNEMTLFRNIDACTAARSAVVVQKREPLSRAAQVWEERRGLEFMVQAATSSPTGENVSPRLSATAL